MAFSIAEILQAQGDAAAKARQARGTMWGSLAQYAGTIPREIIAGEQQKREQAQVAQVRQLQIQKGQAEAQQQQDEQGKLEVLRQVYRVAQDPTTGKLDEQRAAAIIAQSRFPELTEFMAKAKQAGLDKELEASVKRSTIAENTAHAGLYTAQANAVGKPDGAQDFTLPPGSSRYDAKGNLIVTAPAGDKPETRSLEQQANDALKRGDTQEYKRIKDLHAEWAATGRAPDDIPDLSPDGQDVAARVYANTGNLPALGFGKAAAVMRGKIIDRAAALYPDLDISTSRATYQADSAALKDLNVKRASISAFEQTAQKNIDLFLQQAGKVVDTGSPLANRTVRSVSGSVLGSPDQAAFNAARQVAINEIAKVTQGGGLSGVLSDTARREIAAFNPESATLAQTVAVLRVLRQDMANRTLGLDTEIAATKSRLQQGPAKEPSAGTGAAPGGRVYYDTDGKPVTR